MLLKTQVEFDYGLTFRGLDFGFREPACILSTARGARLGSGGDKSLNEMHCAEQGRELAKLLPLAARYYGGLNNYQY